MYISRYEVALIIFLVFAVWAFDTESECWSLMEAKGDIPVGIFVCNYYFLIKTF